MKIRVTAYKEGVPVPLHYQCAAAELDVKFDDMRFETLVDVNGTVEREEKILRFFGIVSAKVTRICGRTLVEVPENWSAKFDWFFDSENVESVEPDGELRELIILDHPMVFRAPGADKPVEYMDVEDEKKRKSPFQDLKKKIKD